MFPEYAYSAFQTNLDSLNTTTSVTIDYIFKEVKIILYEMKLYPENIKYISMLYTIKLLLFDLF